MHTYVDKTPSRYFNSMIHPLFRTTIHGVLWYQGESDKSQSFANKYFCSLTSMVRDWREKWSLKSDTSTDVPFGILQIASSGSVDGTICGNNEGCAATGTLRWAQTGNYGYLPNPSLPNTFGASSADLGEPSGDLHPLDKKPFGERVFSAALNFVYGYTDVYW